MNKRSQVVVIIALWLIFSNLPGIYKDVMTGWDLVLSPMATVAWAYYLCAFLCALGLLFYKEWARQAAIWLFTVYMFWSCYVAYFLMGPSFQQMIDLLGEGYHLSVDIVRSVMITLIMTHILWPVIVVLFLSHPGVKEVFKSRKKVSIEDG